MKSAVLQNQPGIDSGKTLPVMESFYTIQGEGYHQGKAAWFVRLAGCDVGCVWCDVKDSWDKEGHPVVSFDPLPPDIQNSPSDIVVITGGEPLLHPLDFLTWQLHKKGKNCHLETSGAHPLSGDWDWICLSPKKFKAPLEEVCAVADELKVVVFNNSDFDWAERYAEKMKPACKLYLQPEWGRERQMLPQIIEYVLKNPQWEISLQLHKYMNIP